MSKGEYKCKECGWIGKEYLSAKSPFDENDILTACPECLDVNNLVRVCEIKFCKNQSTCGIQSDNGYIFCCSDHYCIISSQT